MRRRTLLLATCVALPVALAAAAQQEADRRLDAAIARARAALAPGETLEFRDRRVDPVSGEARLTGVTLRRAGRTLTIEEVTLRDVDEARIGAANARGLRLADNPAAPGATKDAAPAPQPGAMTAARVTLAGLSLPAVAGGPGVDWSAAAVDSALVEAVALDLPNRDRFEAGRLSLTGYAPGAVREAVVEGLTFAENSAASPGRMRLGRARLAGAVLPRPGQPFDPWALAADSAAVEGIEMTIPGQNFGMRLGRLQVDGWGEGRMTGGALEGFQTNATSPDTGPFAMTLGRFSLAGVPAYDTARAILAGVNPPQAAPGQVQTADIEGLTVSLAGTQVLALGAVRGRNDWDAANPNTQVGTLAVEGIAVDLPPEFGGAWLDTLGYKTIGGRIDNTTRLGRTDGRILADPFTIRADGMGTLGFTLDLRGYQVPQPGQSAAPEQALATMMAAQVSAFTIRYTDEGLVGRLIAQQARNARVPEARLRDQFAQMALQTPIPGGTGKDSPSVDRIRQALASFARQSGTIEIAMRPRRPMPLGDLAGLAAIPPAQAVEQLGITATATPPRR